METNKLETTQPINWKKYYKLKQNKTNSAFKQLDRVLVVKENKNITVGARNALF